MAKSTIAGELGLDTQLSYGDTAETCTTELAGIVRIESPGGDTEKVDTTDMDTVNHKTAVSGELEDTDDIVAEVKYFKTQHNALIGLISAMKYFKIEFPDGSTEVYYGFLAGKPSVTAETQNILSGTIRIKVCDEPDFSAAG